MDQADSSSSHRSFELISDSHFTEYRYYANNHRHGSFHIYAWLDSLVVGMFSYSLYRSFSKRWHLSACIAVFILYSYWRCHTVIYESMIVIPPHGVQLETHRGPFKSLLVSRRFIPAVYIQDIIINEALHRWNVRYYLAIIVGSPGENRKLAVAFENTLPHFPVLRKVYHGVNKALYDD